MEKEKKEEIAMFRFGVISTLIGLRKTEYGEREKRIKEIREAVWDIPGSRRNYISRSTLLGWVKRYDASGRKLDSLYPKERKDKGVIKSIDEDMQAGILRLNTDFHKTFKRHQFYNQAVQTIFSSLLLSQGILNDSVRFGTLFNIGV